MNYAINQLDMIDDDVACDIKTDYSRLLKIPPNFLLDQLKYLINKKQHRRYNKHTQAFALKVYGISPASYPLIQSSFCLILPHERNILKKKYYWVGK